MFSILIDPEQPILSRMKRKTPPTKTFKGTAKRPKTQKTAKAAITTLQTEIGYFDTAITTDATTTAAIVALQTMAAGDTNVTRDGNKIGMLALSLRIGYSAEALSPNNQARFVVVLDKQSNATALNWTDVFIAATISSQRAIAGLSRFDILMDKVVTLNSTTSTAAALQKGFFKKYIKMPNIIAAYASGAADLAITNNLTLMYIGSEAAGTTDLDVVGTSRLFFNR